ncbi:LysR family transcriptional regulator [Amorphus orientalis]|uniref:DNA-binding transcriptional LysR family regulator n=1 Tax=Amorphus orientalis TaxID=649198 RepID=A0AAE3VU25_9HYPH|nr:LysR family transcriptional regulator [Amorphus orientalis]MDQ0317860.1 DNA-binding transcriptional LysR family regulator [Amorphus orientalis]
MLPSLNSMVSRLRVKHFRLLVALDDHGSILKAAEQVALSQPGATKALQEIESALGEPLFVRTNRGLEPNEVGHCVIRYARLIYTDLAHLREEMSGILNGHGGRLAVGTIMGAVPITTEILSRLLGKQPSLSVQIIEGTSEGLLRMLDDGRLDVALCRTSVSHRREAYEAINVRQEQLAVVANVDHPDASANSLELGDLADRPWIVCATNMPMRRYLEREFYDAGIEFPLNVVEATSAFAVVSMIQRNRSTVALLSTDAAEFFARFGMITILPIRLETPSEPYFLVTHRDRTLPPSAQLFIDEFLEATDRLDDVSGMASSPFDLAPELPTEPLEAEPDTVR